MKPSNPIPTDAEELARQFESFRPRLERMLDLRVDPRLRSRLDAADVLQEACAEVLRRAKAGRVDQRLPFYVWVRFIALQCLVQAQRRHIGTVMRDPSLEVALDDASWGVEASAERLGDCIAESTLSPSQRLSLEEERARVRSALAELRPLDREILALRHFEQLSNSEAAHVLALPESTAAQRYLRALERLRRALERRAAARGGPRDGPGSAGATRPGRAPRPDGRLDDCHSGCS